MAPPAPKAQAARKRTRKRKRRNVSSSSESSSSDDSSSDTDAPQQAVVRVAVKGAATKKTQSQPAPTSDPSSSSSSPSSESESSDSDVEPARGLSPPDAAATKSINPSRRPPSPTPPPTSVPSFLSGPGASEQEKEKEQALKERFRKFWMASVADAFKDDLEEIRKHEPNLTTSRLAMLIDSLAAGGDVLTSSRVGPESGMTEMEIVLEHNT
ncbi:hypothetical protein C8Q79DRAFT_1015080 [Trametes meyenii]|nr:hypothetical protein C8Q79DRAFT_1015080 [Trametes meyenii]